jgi:hypothetical protein
MIRIPSLVEGLFDIVNRRDARSTAAPPVDATDAGACRRRRAGARENAAAARGAGAAGTARLLVAMRRSARRPGAARDRRRAIGAEGAL